jgi:hypothetical protein
MSQLAGRLLVDAGFVEAQDNAPATRRLRQSQGKTLALVKEAGKRGSLCLLVAVEKAIVQDDFNRYVNSKAMESSLRNALLELEAMERHLSIVDDQAEYRRVDKAHALPRNRKNGLPFDEARQAFASHIARLGNLDKSRLSDTEKALIDARKANMQQAAKLYAERQAKALGVELPPSRLQGEGA